MATPYRNMDMVAIVVRYREDGKSFREIAKILNRDVKVIYRWWKYALEADLVSHNVLVGSLSTGKSKTR